MSTSIRKLFCEALATTALGAAQNSPATSKIGPKGFFLEGGGEDQLLQTFLSDEHRSLDSQHITIERSLSRGLWLDSEKVVEVTTQKGVCWATHGYMCNGKLCLTVEEAVFLMESGNLEVFSAGLPMSIHQAYHTLIQPHNLQQYQVYAYLKRAGYLVQKRTYSDSSVLEAWRCRIPFRKSHLGPPNYRLIIARVSDPFPTNTRLHQLSQLTPQAPLWCAVVDGSNLTFYALENSEMITI
ncbi:hypothetical protein EMCRGX_G027489 [Ephydatia muelleri]